MEKKLTTLIDKALSRRGFLAGSGTLAGAALLAGCSSGTDYVPPSPTPTKGAYTDTDYLNFALNLEYLEAEFYLRAVTGSGLSATDAGSGAGSVTGGAQVTFVTPAYAAYAALLAQDELNHVRLLRTALGSAAVPRPAIDYVAGFGGIATAASLPSTFSPFANEMSFFVGGFSFEDVGQTAYAGAAPLLTSSANLNSAAGLQAVESYHGGMLRTIIAGSASVAGADQTYLNAANAIITVRGNLGGGNETPLSTTSIVPATSANAIAYARTTDQVLHILYGMTGAGLKSGGFFPNGLNGNISVTAS